MARSNRMRFFAWYRAVPLAVVGALCLISLVYSFAPAFLFGIWYPLRYEEEIVEASTRHNVDPYLVAAVIKTESDGDAHATSSQGAEGLMQLLPETAQDMIDKGLVDGSQFSADDLYDPATNIEFGCAYLSYLIRYFNGSTDKAIAAYNAGMGNVDNWSANDTVLHNAITFPETQAYLVRVKTARARYQSLYPDSFM